MEGSKRLRAPLDTPIKRAGFAILILGAALTLIGFIQIGADLSSYRWLEKLMASMKDALCFDRYTYRIYPLACIGPYVLLVGLLSSYLYDKTFGRFLAWIRHG